MLKASKGKHTHKVVAFFNLLLLELVDLQSACYGVNLHGVHSMTGIHCELNIQLLTLHAGT